MQEYPELSRIVNAFFRRGVMPETYETEKTTKTEDKKNNHPLKNKPFYGIPRHIALMPGITDRIFRLISILCSAFGDDGHIEFKIKTLSIVMGSKSDKAMRRIIKEAEELELIETIQTGRSLKFTLSDKFYSNGPVEIKAKNDRSGAVKNVRTDRSKMTAPYHLEKKALKTTAKAPAGAAADVQKIRSKIDPEISRKIANDALEKLMGIPVERIEAASKEVMASRVKNKVGLFIKLANEIPPDNGLKPQDPPPDSTPKQKACIECYNSNCRKSEPTCQTMKPDDNGVRNHPSGPCKKYCPFVLQNLELFNLKKPVQDPPPQQTPDQEQIGTDELKSMLSELRNKFSMKL